MISVRAVAFLLAVICLIMAISECSGSRITRDTSDPQKSLQDIIEGAKKQVDDLLAKAKETANFDEFSKKASQLMEDAQQLYKKNFEAKAP